MDPDPAALSSLVVPLSSLAAGLAIGPPALAVEAVVFVLLLLTSAVLSGSEVALFSLDAGSRDLLAQTHDRASRRVRALLQHPHHLLATLLLLSTFVNVAAVIVAVVAVARVAQTLSVDPTLTTTLGVVGIGLVVLVVSEVTPRLVAARHALAFSRRASVVLMALHRLLYPVSSLLARLLQTFQERLPVSGSSFLSAADLRAMMKIGQAHGTLEQEERDLLHSLVEFSETTVREIMVSRMDVAALPVTATLPEALDLIRTSGHSRLPLYDEHLDHILGIIYAKDLLPYLQAQRRNGPIDWVSLARAPMLVPLGKNLNELLKDFQAKKTHMAIVVDEYGGTAGLVTLEDVLEEIVGDIRDEHDEPEAALYEQVDARSYRFNARINLDDLNDLLATDIDTEAFDFETLGGLIFHLVGDIPSEGDEIPYGPLQMRVETIDNHRIGRVLVRAENHAADEVLVERRASGNS